MYHDNPSIYVFIARFKGMKETGKTREDVWEWVEEEYPLNPPLSLLGKSLFSFSWRPEKIRKVATRAIEHVYDGVPVPPRKKTSGGELKRLQNEIDLLEAEKKKKELIERRKELIEELKESKNESEVVTPKSNGKGSAKKKA